MGELTKQELRTYAEKKAFVCCGNTTTGGEYAGQVESVCCGNPEETGDDVSIPAVDMIELLDELEALRQDAERYRALREMNWCDGPLAVVADPYSRIKLGSDCPSHERLDQVVDSIMAKAASADAGVVDYD